METLRVHFKSLWNVESYANFSLNFVSKIELFRLQIRPNFSKTDRRKFPFEEPFLYGSLLGVTGSVKKKRQKSLYDLE